MEICKAVLEQCWASLQQHDVQLNDRLQIAHSNESGSIRAGMQEQGTVTLLVAI